MRRSAKHQPKHVVVGWKCENCQTESRHLHLIIKGHVRLMFVLLLNLLVLFRRILLVDNTTVNLCPMSSTFSSTIREIPRHYLWRKLPFVAFGAFRASQYLLELVSRAPPVLGRVELITLLWGLGVLGRGALLHRSHPSYCSSMSSLLLQVLV